MVVQRPYGALPGTRCPKRRHVGLGPGFVDEDQGRGVDAVLIGHPLQVLPPTTLKQPVSVLTNDLLRPAASHRLGRHTARLAEPAKPVDRRLDAYPKAVGCLPA
jgi:hypothetical protein